MLNLKLGEVVTIGGAAYVVATVTGLPPSYFNLVLVPEGREARDLGKTWTRAESESLTLLAPSPPPPTASLDAPPPVPVAGLPEPGAPET